MILKRQYKILIFIAISAVIVFSLWNAFGVAVRAAETLDPGVEGIGQTTGLGSADIRVVAGRIIQYALGFLGVVAVGLIIYGGFVYMTAGGDMDKIGKAKKILISAIIGLVIIFSAYAITAFVINKIMQATGATALEAGGTGEPGGLIIGGGGYFIASQISPQGDTSLNAKVHIRFSDAVNGDTVKSNTVIITRTSDGQKVPGKVGVYGSAKNSVRFIPSAACLDSACGDDYCFEKNTTYKVTLMPGAIKSTGGTGLSCSAWGICVATFTTGATCDKESPNVLFESPSDGAKISEKVLAPVQIWAQDDTALDEIFLLADDQLVDSVGAAGVNTKEQEVSFVWDTATGTVALGKHKLTARATDMAENSGKRDINVKVLPEKCFGDAGELICGDPVCGACDGDECTSNEDCIGECVSGHCVSLPTITNVLPSEGGPGNLVSVIGTGFGKYDSSLSKVFFKNSTGQYIEAKLGCRSTAAWTDFQIIAEVPVGVANGPIKIINKNGKYDTTDNDRGWKGDYIVKSGQDYPGLCSVLLESCATNCGQGVVNQNVKAEGTNFGTKGPDDLVYFGEAPARLGAWTNTKIENIKIPNLEPNYINVVVGKGEQCLRAATEAGANPTICQKGEDGCICTAIFSNPVKFIIAAAQNLPTIQSIDPATGPAKQFITLVGANFGSAVGRVVFGNPLGEEFLAGAVCGATAWRNDQIAVKVPEALIGDKVGDYQVVVYNSDNLPSDPKFFTVTAGAPSPGICSLTPDNGPAGAAVDIKGENFGVLGDYNILFARTGQAGDSGAAVSKVDEWTGTQIKGAIVPLEAITGAVYLKHKQEDKISNKINFKVGSCTATSCDTQETCCPSGVCQPLESGQTPEVVCRGLGSFLPSEYVWLISTGALPKIPHVLERACVVGTIPESPSPARANITACPNAMISATFNLLINPDTLNQAITIKRCKTQGLQCDLDQCGDDCVRQVVRNVDLGADVGSTNSSVSCLKDGRACTPGLTDCECQGGGESVTEFHLLASLGSNPELSGADGVVKKIVLDNGDRYDLYENTWYQIELKGGSGGMATPAGENLPEDYKWSFKTRTGICTPDVLLMKPIRGLIEEINGQEKFQVSGQYQCQDIGMQNEAWQWESLPEPITNLMRAVFGSYGSNSDGAQRQDIGLFKINSALVDANGNATAALETPVSQPQTIRTSAIISQDGVFAKKEKITKDAELEIRFKDPKVIAYGPNCEEACINGQIWADFNTQMKAVDFTADNVKLYSCTAKDCVVLNPVSFGAADSSILNYQYGLGADQLMVSQMQINLPDNLLPNKYYRVVLNGDIQSQSGVKLTGLNYGQIQEDRLALNYTFNEGRRTKVLDHSPRQHDGELKGNLHWTTDGVNGQALIFNGTDSYLDLGKVEDLNIAANQDFSISLWFKAGVGSTGALISKIDISAPGVWWGVSLAKNRVFFRLNNNSVLSRPFTLNTWQHLAVVYQASGQGRVYLNGVLSTTKNLSTQNLANEGSVLLGRWPDATAPAYFTGAMDEVKFYKGALTASEVASLYNEFKYGASRHSQYQSFSWVFKTKNDSSQCLIDRVSIQPEDYISETKGEQVEYLAKPAASPDACDANGQSLNPYRGYDWSWTNSQSLVATLTNLQYNLNQPTFCTDKCLNRGGATFAAVCGNGTVEAGEECEFISGNNSEIKVRVGAQIQTVAKTAASCDESTCLIQSFSNCTKAQLDQAAGTVICCGNGIKEGHEQCDEGCVYNAAGVCVSKGQSCANGCLNAGTGSGFNCGNSLVEAGEDADFGSANNVAAGLDANKCTYKGATYKEGEESLGAVCGNGTVEAGEECESDNPNCNSKCLWQGFTSCTDNNNTAPCCGNGKLEGAEECEASAVSCLKEEACTTEEDCVNHKHKVSCAFGTAAFGTAGCQCSLPAWCSAKCLNLGSSATYGSVCGDGQVGSGEDAACDPTNLAKKGSPYQIAQVLPNIDISNRAVFTRDASGYTKGSTTLTASTAETQVVSGVPTAVTKVGFTPLTYRTKECLADSVALTESLPANGAGQNSGTDPVCRNALIYAVFNQKISKEDLKEDNIKLYSVQSEACEQIALPGLDYGVVRGDSEWGAKGSADWTTLNPKTAVQSSISVHNVRDLERNTTHVYSGQFYDAEGKVAFYENFDDSVYLKIDGQVLMNYIDGRVAGVGEWALPHSTGILSLGAGQEGWHDFELRLGQAAGGSGPPSGKTLGFGFNPDPNVDNFDTAAEQVLETNYIPMSDPGAALLFRHWQSSEEGLAKGEETPSSWWQHLLIKIGLAVEPHLCLQNATFTIGQNSVNHTTVTVLPTDLLAEATNYRLVFKDLRDSCAVVQADFTINFKTGSDICRLDKVALFPTSNFVTKENQTFPNYVAYGQKEDQLIREVSGVYEWSWLWQSLDSTIASVTAPTCICQSSGGAICREGSSVDCSCRFGQENCHEGEQENQATVSTFKKNGKTLIKALAVVTKDELGKAQGQAENKELDTTGSWSVNYSAMEVFICDNPWDPNISGNSWQKIFAWASEGYTVPTFLREKNYNAGLFYCRDFGASGFTDDLPKLKATTASLPVAPTQCNDGVDNDNNGLKDIADPKCASASDPWEQPKMLAQYFFTRDRGTATATQTSYNDDGVYGDIISLRIYENPEALAPDQWYQRYVPQPSSSTSRVEVDCQADDFDRYCYQSAQDGTSLYMAAANVYHPSSIVKEIYNNIYLLGYNQGANSATKNIYGQLVNFIKFNIEQDGSLFTKDVLIRDTQRVSDLVSLRSYIVGYQAQHSGQAPLLESGSYLRGQVYSLWPSWQKELGGVLGKTVPADPQNHFEWKPAMGSYAGVECKLCTNAAGETCTAGSLGCNCLGGQCPVNYQCVSPGYCQGCPEGYAKETCYNSVEQKFYDYYDYTKTTPPAAPKSPLYYYRVNAANPSRFELRYKLETENSGYIYKVLPVLNFNL